MKITCNSRQNVAYIRLREKRAEVETLRISDELNIDPAPTGPKIADRDRMMRIVPSRIRFDQGKELT